MLQYLQRLMAERDSLTRTANGITEAATTESRDLNDAEQESLRTMQERCAVIDGQLTTYNAQAESQRAYASLRTAIADDGERHEEGERRAIERRAPAAPAPHGWGEIFVRSAQFREYSGRGRSGEVEVPGIFTRAASDPIMTSTDPWDTLTRPTIYSPALPTQTTPLLAAVGSIQTANNFITLWRMPTPYPTAQEVAEGALKPPADIVPTEETHTLNTYAHWKAISRQALEDIPQIQSTIEQYLRGGINLAIESGVAAALAAAALQTVSGAADALAAIRVAVATAQSAGFPNANQVALNPLDYASLDIAVMGATSNGPVSGAPFWGLAPIPVPGIPQGTAYVGDFRAGVTVYTRGTASVFLTDSHADYFLRNLLVILAEARAYPIVEQPAALVEVTGLVAPATAPLSGGSSGTSGATASAK